MKPPFQYSFLLAFFLLGNIALAQDVGLTLANAEITKLAAEKNYLPTDVATMVVSDDYVSGGIRHIYFQQAIDQIGIYGTSAAVHIKDGQIISSNLQFLPQLEKRNIQKQFQVQALEAVARLAINKGYPLSQTELLILEADDASPNQATTVSNAGISNRTIPLKLVYFVNETADVQLAWNLFIDEVDDAEYKNYVIDAATGDILLEKDLTVRCSFDHDHDDHTTCTDDFSRHQAESQATTESRLNYGTSVVSAQAATMVDSSYNVLKYDIESPNFGTRSVEVQPWTNKVASPNGWHRMFGIDYEYTLGNNVDAYADRDNTNDPTGENNSRAFGGTNLTFDEPWDVNGNPTTYTEAGIVNLFYMNNIAHDVFYNYGFDEVSGNFQEENFGKGGNGSDNVIAEAQDASGTCNANMSTPGDGANPRMQMYICANRDGDFDNAIILHEFGHGVSNRLTGGPNAVACLGNVEQMGEGWSDFFGLIFTMKPTDVATTNRTIGTFLFNQDANGAGLRPYPFTTDMSVNPMTYKTIDDEGISRPHGVGAVWATMLWDLNWALIDQYGWNADIYDGATTISNTTGGNNIALRLVIEGLKMQPCSPGFVDARDAIIAADQALYNGIHQCLIWEVFARRGLGFSADQGSTNSREDGAEGYDMPPACTIELEQTANRESAFLGERITFQLKATNHLDAIATNIIVTDTIPENVQFYAASDGATVNGNIVEWPAFDLAPNSSRQFELTVQVNDTIAFEENFLDDLETNGDNWKQVQVSGNHVWNRQSTYYFSPSHAWFITNANTTTETHLVLKEPLALSATSELSFNHSFNLEDRYDFGLVEISVDGGVTWIDLENNFTQNGYNNYTQFGHFAYSNTSTAIIPNNNSFITTKADLSPYAGEVAIIRFRLLTDINTANFGWIVDDIGISNTNYALPNFGNIRNGDYNFDTQTKTPVIIDQSKVNHTVETQPDTLMIFENATATFVDVQANDIDADGPLDTLLTTILRTATNGTATVANEDSISYTPNASFSGRDTVVYQVCDESNACESDTLFVMVQDLNLPPVAMADFETVIENSTNNLLDVQANDSDPNGAGDVLQTTILENALHGTATVETNKISYTPTTDYFGSDTIVYQVCDPANLCDADTVFITVQFLSQPPVANTDFLVLKRNDINKVVQVQANDSDPDGLGDTLITSILKPALNGTAMVIADDSISYTPSIDFVGLDTVVYQVCDTSNLCAADTIFITVNDFNEGPTANSDNLMVVENSTNNVINVQLNDADPNGVGDSLITTITKNPLNGMATVVSDDSISYTPTMDYFGLDTLEYQVCDTANLCATSFVAIMVLEENLPPVAQPDFVEIAKNTKNKHIDVQANDMDPNGLTDMLTTTILAGAFHGIAGVVDGDSLIYTPTADYLGLDTIVYQICDVGGLCDSDTVFITYKDAFFCESDNLVKNESDMVDGSYVASNAITSSGIISETAKVKFVAGTSILLTEGFHVKAGANFVAMIENCESGNNLANQPELEKNNYPSTISLENNRIHKGNKLLVRPNPFRQNATIDYELGQDSRVWIGLYDLTGRIIHVFVNQQAMDAGQYQYQIAAANLTSGTYWVSMRTQDSVLTKKIIILNN